MIGLETSGARFSFLGSVKRSPDGQGKVGRCAGGRSCVSVRLFDRDPRNGRLRMSEPRALVEHFFRHEFGRLCAGLTRSLGVRRLDLVEDVVQAALVQALETWSRRGVPEDTAGWLYRTARNLAS